MKKLLHFLPVLSALILFSCNNKNSSGGGDYEKVKQNNLAVLKAIESGDLSTLDKYIAADAVDHSGTTGELHGLEAIKKDMSAVRTAYPDMKFEILGTAMDGDLFYCWAKMTGTQKGEFMGVPATGQPFTMTSVDVIKLKDDKMVEHWGFMDMGEAMKMMNGAGAAGNTGGDKMMSDSSKMSTDTAR